MCSDEAIKRASREAVQAVQAQLRAIYGDDWTAVWDRFECVTSARIQRGRVTVSARLVPRLEHFAAIAG